jgi:hypothetical protein
METTKHPLTEAPATPALRHLLHQALAVAHERGAAPTHWSHTDLGLDSAPAWGLMLWQERRPVVAIDPAGYMVWFA